MGWRLLHFVRATPLSVWTELFPFSIEEIIAAGVATPLYHDSNHPSLALNALMEAHLARHLSPFLQGADGVRE